MNKTSVTVCAAFLFALVAWCGEMLPSDTKSIWVKGAEREMNAYYGFSAQFNIKPGERPTIRFSAGGIARVWVNGTFAAYGPARAPEGYMRMDE